jgi:hypothetical protein
MFRPFDWVKDTGRPVGEVHQRLGPRLPLREIDRPGVECLGLVDASGHVEITLQVDRQVDDVRRTVDLARVEGRREEVGPLDVQPALGVVAVVELRGRRGGRRRGSGTTKSNWGRRARSHGRPTRRTDRAGGLRPHGARAAGPPGGLGGWRRCARGHAASSGRTHVSGRGWPRRARESSVGLGRGGVGQGRGRMTVDVPPGVEGQPPQQPGPGTGGRRTAGARARHLHRARGSRAPRPDALRGRPGSSLRRHGCVHRRARPPAEADRPARRSGPRRRCRGPPRPAARRPGARARPRAR